MWNWGTLIYLLDIHSDLLSCQLGHGHLHLLLRSPWLGECRLFKIRISGIKKGILLTLLDPGFLRYCNTQLKLKSFEKEPPKSGYLIYYFFRLCRLSAQYLNVVPASKRRKTMVRACIFTALLYRLKPEKNVDWIRNCTFQTRSLPTEVGDKAMFLQVIV